MEEKNFIKIEIEGDKVAFSTDLTIPEMNYWLDYIKYLILSGQAKSANE